MGSVQASATSLRSAMEHRELSSIHPYFDNPDTLPSKEWGTIRTLTHPDGVPGWPPAGPDWTSNFEQSKVPGPEQFAKFGVSRPMPSPFDDDSGRFGYGSGSGFTTFEVPATMTLTDALTALLAALSAIGCFFEVAVAPGEVSFGDTVHGGHRVGGLVYVSDMSNMRSYRTASAPTASAPKRLVLTFMRRHGKRDSWMRLVYKVAIEAKFTDATTLPPLLRSPGLCVACSSRSSAGCTADQASIEELKDFFGFFVDPDADDSGGGGGGGGGAREGGGGGGDLFDDDGDLFDGVFLPCSDDTESGTSVRHWLR